MAKNPFAAVRSYCGQKKSAQLQHRAVGINARKAWQIGCVKLGQQNARSKHRKILVDGRHPANHHTTCSIVNSKAWEKIQLQQVSHGKKKYFPLYWVVNRDPYNGLL